MPVSFGGVYIFGVDDSESIAMAEWKCSSWESNFKVGAYNQQFQGTILWMVFGSSFNSQFDLVEVVPIYCKKKMSQKKKNVGTANVHRSLKNSIHPSNTRSSRKDVRKTVALFAPRPLLKETHLKRWELAIRNDDGWWWLIAHAKTRPVVCWLRDISMFKKETFWQHVAVKRKKYIYIYMIYDDICTV